MKNRVDLPLFSAYPCLAVDARIAKTNGTCTICGTSIAARYDRIATLPDGTDVHTRCLAVHQ
jgi:hypothetical protein